ncbi:unnamed protein product, partial [Polarella glacialis]
LRRWLFVGSAAASSTDAASLSSPLLLADQSAEASSGSPAATAQASDAFRAKVGRLPRHLQLRRWLSVGSAAASSTDA